MGHYWFMTSYWDWNIEIYKNFLNEISTQGMMFFCVDSDFINSAGSKLNIQNNAEEEFCKCVLSEILNKSSSGYYKISTKKKYYGGYDNKIPYQTAIIAFFIYIASKMGENPEYRTSAYWPLFNEVAEKYYQPYDDTKKTSCYDFLFSIFEDFKKQINKQHNIEFDFPSLWNRKDKRDFVGLPIFQSMISAKDKCILTQKFFELRKFPEFDINYVVQGDNYSNVFKKIRDNDEYKQCLFERIKSIAEAWDGTVYEYDTIKKTKRHSVLPLIYQYKIDANKDVQFFITTNKTDNLDICFKNFKLTSNNPRTRLPSEEITIREQTYKIENSGLKIARPSSKYILFKKDFISGLYTEVFGNNKVKVGDTFSVLAPVEFFNDEYNIDSIQKVISDYDEENSNQINDRLYLLHGAIAQNYNNEFVFMDNKDKITFRKGLNSLYKSANSYIKGAEPLITVENIKNVDIDGQTYYIEPKTEYGKDVYKKTFDITKQHNECGQHHIKLENSLYQKQYEIVPISNMPKQTAHLNFIFNVIDKNIEKINYWADDKKTVTGAYFNNIEESFSDNLKKLPYILKILEQHKNTGQFIMPKDMQKELFLLASDNEQLREYINNNLYIDNYIYQYLSKLKEA